MQGTILLVEDYDDTRFLMKFMLERLGYKIVEAVDGLEAVEFAKQIHPNLILMDLALPEMDGITATGIIRRTAGVSKIPVVAITAHSGAYRDAALEAGCNQVIGKPVDMESLQPVVSQYM